MEMVFHCGQYSPFSYHSVCHEYRYSASSYLPLSLLTFNNIKYLSTLHTGPKMNQNLTNIRQPETDTKVTEAVDVSGMVCGSDIQCFKKFMLTYG